MLRHRWIAGDAFENCRLKFTVFFLRDKNLFQVLKSLLHLRAQNIRDVHICQERK